MKPIKASFEGSSEYFFKVFLCDCEADFLLRSLISIDVETNFKFLPGGVSPSERGLAWRFLFGMYSCSSTALERSLLQEQLMVRYQVMKRKWQQLIPSAVRMHLNNSDGKRHKRRPMFTKKKNPIYLLNVSLFFFFWSFLYFPAELVAAVQYFDQRQAQAQQQTLDLSEEVRERLAFLELQAQVRSLQWTLMQICSSACVNMCSVYKII